MRRTALLLALTACSDARVFVALPSGATSTTWVIGQRAPLQFGVLDEPPRFEGMADDDSLEVFLLEYERSRDELGLTPGPLAANAACRPCALSKPDRIYASREGKAFVPVPERPPWLLEALVPDAALRCVGCRVQLKSELVPNEFQDGVGGLFLLRWAEDAVLFLDATEGAIARLTDERGLERLCDPGAPFPDATSAMLSQAGELWIANELGVLSSLLLSELQSDRPCKSRLVTRSQALGQPVVELAGPPDQNTLDIYALSSSELGVLSLQRFHDGAWSALFQFAEGRMEPSIAYGSDGWTYAVGGGNELARVRGTELEIETLPDGFLPRQLTVVRDLPGFGLLLGDRFDGLLKRNMAGDFAPVATREVSDRDGDRYRGLIRFAGGVLMGTSRGEARFYSESEGYCDEHTGLFGHESATNLVAVSGSVVFSGRNDLYKASSASGCPFESQ